MMAKIIQFPGTLTEPVKQDDDGFYEDQITKVFIEDFVDRVGHGLVNEFYNNGYDVDDEEFVLRFMYSMEVMKSVLYNSKDLEHKLSPRTGRQAKQYFNQEANGDDE
jgi:hypothetical protein